MWVENINSFLYLATYNQGQIALTSYQWSVRVQTAMEEWIDIGWIILPVLQMMCFYHVSPMPVYILWREWGILIEQMRVTYFPNKCMTCVLLYFYWKNNTCASRAWYIFLECYKSMWLSRLSVFFSSYALSPIFWYIPCFSRRDDLSNEMHLTLQR